MPKPKPALQGKVIYVPDVQKPLPASVDAEKGVLGSCLISPDKVIPILIESETDSTSFHHPAHGRIWDTLIEMRNQSLPIDLVTLTNHLENQKLLNEVGGAAAITELFTFVPTSSNVLYYLEILKEKKVLRDLIYAGTEYAHRAYEEQGEAELLSAEAAARFNQINQITVRPENEDYDSKSMMFFLDKMEELANGSKKPEFFVTGLPAHDEECGGLARGELLLIRGRKGTGKSLLGQKIISMNCLEHGSRRAGIWTYEMPYDQMMRRLVADLGSVSLKSMRDGRYTKAELNSFQTTVSKIMASNVKIYDTKRLKHRTPEALFASIRRHAKNHGLDLILIDHLHLIKFPKGKGEMRADEQLHEFSSELKAICLELEIAGILLAQENTEGGTFGGSQVETDCDTSICLLPEEKVMNGFKRVVGTSGIFYDKCREGNLLGRKIPVTMEGQYARINQTVEAGGKF